MDFSKLSDWLKLSPRYLFPISLVTGFAVFARSNVLDIFGLTQLVSQFRPYLGIAFLLSATLLITNWTFISYEWGKKKIKQRQDAKSMFERLHSLTDDEKLILRGYIEQQTRTQYLSINDGVVNGLELEQIIFRASNIGHLDEWAYNIQPWVWKYLNSHPELVAPGKNDQGQQRRHIPRWRRWRY